MTATAPSATPAAVPAATTAAVGELRDRPPVDVVLSGVTRAYGPTLALDSLDLHIAGGEFLAVLGPSGCGKTTALRAIAGFEVPDAGTITVGGRDLTTVPPSKRDMGMVFQAYSLFPNLSALDNVGYGLAVRRRGKAERRRRSAELLELVGLADQGDRYPHQLSGGQQQRVALARALAVAPQVLLLDEPLSALDAQVRVQLRDEIRRIQLELGTTTVFVTHDQAEALSVADRVAVLRAGRLEQVASPDELYSRPASAFVARFVGTTSVVPAQVRADGGIDLLGTTRAADGPVPTGEVVALLRPEQVLLRADDHGAARVVTRTFSGGTTRVTAVLPDGTEVSADLLSTESGHLVPGTAVHVEPTARPVLVVPAGEV